MDEKLAPSDIAALFHSVLFAYQKGLADIASTSFTTHVRHRMMPYLDSVFKHSLGQIGKLDAETALKNFSQLLVDSELAEDVVVEKREKGFEFTVKGCVFAGHVHELLKPKDVTCPYGILATYLAEKCTGFSVKKALSDFDLTDSITVVEFEKKLGWF